MRIYIISVMIGSLSMKAIKIRSRDDSTQWYYTLCKLDAGFSNTGYNPSSMELHQAVLAMGQTAALGRMGLGQSGA